MEAALDDVLYRSGRVTDAEGPGLEAADGRRADEQLVGRRSRRDEPLRVRLGHALGDDGDDAERRLFEGGHRGLEGRAEGGEVDEDVGGRVELGRGRDAVVFPFYWVRRERGGLRRGRKKEGEEAGRRDRRRRLWRSLLSFFSSLSLSSPAHDGDRHLLLAEERLVEAPVGSSGLDDDGDRGGLAA